MTNNIPINIDGNKIEYVIEYVYLGRLMSFDKTRKDRNEKEVNRRINIYYKFFHEKVLGTKGDSKRKLV